MTRHVSLFIRKGDDEDESFRWNDFPVGPFVPHHGAVYCPHGVMKYAAGAEIVFGGNNGDALRPEPFRQMFTLGPQLPHHVAGRVERSRDNELSLSVWCIIFQEVLQRRTNDLRPALHEILPRERRSLRK